MIPYLVFMVLLLGIVIYVLIYFIRLLIPLLYFGAIFVPSSDKRIITMIDFAKISPGMRIIDVGSGDGRILIAAARKGAHATGVEIDPRLIAQSRKTIRHEKLGRLIRVHNKDMWKTDLSSYDVIFIYAMPYMMKRFSEKVRREGKRRVRIISNCNRLPGLMLVEKSEGVYSYEIN